MKKETTSDGERNPAPEAFRVRAGSSRLAAAFAAMFAACLATGDRATAGEAAVTVRYAVSQTFNHQFGSKFTSGSFVRETGHCLVTLTIADKPGAAAPSGSTQAQIRLVLNPGQMAGLDSEEGQSLNLTCSPSAKALIVDCGEKSALAASQKMAVSHDDFDEFVVP